MILFAAIDLPYKITKALSRMQKGVSGARWRSPEQMHITLGYFGDITDDQAEILDVELARTSLPAFEIDVQGGGHFGHNDPYSIWAGLKPSESLAQLNEHCKSAARRAHIPMERRVFKPHITLAYMRSGSPVERIIAFEKNMSKFTAGPFLVDQFDLYSSLPQKKGTNLYRLEATYPLLGEPSII